VRTPYICSGVRISGNCKSIDESTKRLVELAEQQRHDAIEDKKGQKRFVYMSTAITVVAVVVAVVATIVTMLR
jgi:hypothetical protein